MHCRVPDDENDNAKGSEIAYLSCRDTKILKGRHSGSLPVIFTCSVAFSAAGSRQIVNRL